MSKMNPMREAIRRIWEVLDEYANLNVKVELVGEELTLHASRGGSSSTMKVSSKGFFPSREQILDAIRRGGRLTMTKLAKEFKIKPRQDLLPDLSSLVKDGLLSRTGLFYRAADTIRGEDGSRAPARKVAKKAARRRKPAGARAMPSRRVRPSAKPAAKPVARGGMRGRRGLKGRGRRDTQPSELGASKGEEKPRE